MEHNLSPHNSFSLDHLETDGHSFSNQFTLTSFHEAAFLPDIFQPTGSLCSPAESDHTSSAVTVAADVDTPLNDSSGSTSTDLFKSYRKRSAVSAFTLSFDKSTVIPITKESSNLTKTPSSSKRTRGNRKAEPRTKPRSSSEAIHHIIAERKRRQDLTQKFIALAATIPGLKKIDKASVLCEAIKYVKQLQERKRELENGGKRRGTKRKVESPEVCCYCRAHEAIPDMEARVWEDQVLIRIHCERRGDIMLQMVELLETIHLSVLCCSSLPFGNSAVSITIVAQMKEKYSMKVNDLMKYLRHQYMSKSNDSGSG